MTNFPFTLYRNFHFFLMQIKKIHLILYFICKTKVIYNLLEVLFKIFLISRNDVIELYAKTYPDEMFIRSESTKK
jgi:hypothetical protein